MNNYQKNDLKRLLSESLREQPDSYTIQQLLEQFPTTTELVDASEQQLVHNDRVDRPLSRPAPQ